eukprot:4354309-Prymnesium_polylepis.1
MMGCELRARVMVRLKSSVTDSSHFATDCCLPLHGQLPPAEPRLEVVVVRLQIEHLARVEEVPLRRELACHISEGGRHSRGEVPLRRELACAA